MCNRPTAAVVRILQQFRKQQVGSSVQRMLRIDIVTLPMGNGSLQNLSGIAHTLCACQKFCIRTIARRTMSVPGFYSVMYQHTTLNYTRLLQSDRNTLIRHGLFSPESIIAQPRRFILNLFNGIRFYYTGSDLKTSYPWVILPSILYHCGLANINLHIHVQRGQNILQILLDPVHIILQILLDPVHIILQILLDPVHIIYRFYLIQFISFIDST